MISYEEAHQLVLDSFADFGSEIIAIEESDGRILAEDISADRDFPPFDRVTKDGIAINFEGFQHSKSLKIQEVAAAGDTQKSLIHKNDCIEVMTGAMLPKNTDTVVMYEELTIENNSAKINSSPKKGQNIHKIGSDQKKDAVLIAVGEKISSRTIGVIATVGKTSIAVKKLPQVAIISTGNEIVEIGETPKPHQIRSSNSITLKSLLKMEGIDSQLFHIKDDKEQIRLKLKELIEKYDVVMMSGGVSMGKFDFLPEVFEQIGVEKIFHKVAQRPGKPFWFGKNVSTNTTVFSFPGNPNSTFVNFHLYFKDWLNKCLGQPLSKETVIVGNSFAGLETMHHFPLVSVYNLEGKLFAKKIVTNGSGDMISLSKADGVIKVTPGNNINPGDILEFIPF
ncbi:molybdopterin molybdochelatase [Flavobacteriaceae bacterium MAR_2010_188]|nr:molybdopterin molybdochelatase [Flavobacteriaceae bacterium MAR_2010_188]